MSALIAILEFDWTAEAAIDSAKLFAVGGVYDGATYSTSNVTEIVDDGEATGRYRAQFSDLPYGDYHMIVFAEGVGLKSERYTVLDNGGSVFTPWSEAKPLSASDIASAAGLGFGASVREIVITVDDGDDTVIAGARVHVLTEDGDATNQAPTTGVLGTVTLKLNDGTYLLRVVPPNGYIAPDDVELTVTSAETPETISLTATTIEPTPSPGLCTVYTTVIDASGEPIEGAVMRARLVSQNSGTDGAVMVIESVDATSDEEGYVSLDLVRADQFVDGTGEYQITVQYEGEILRNLTATIPNQDSVNLEDIAVS